MPNTVIYNRERMLLDIAEKGWRRTDLARKTKLSDQRIGQFLNGKTNSALVAKKLATALGHSVRRYLVGVSEKAVA